MPKRLTTRPPLAAAEARQVRTLAHGCHAPADWIHYAQMTVRSWDGPRTELIAQEIGCSHLSRPS